MGTFREYKKKLIRDRKRALAKAIVSGEKKVLRVRVKPVKI